jgi:hypothetical protein
MNIKEHQIQTEAVIEDTLMNIKEHLVQTEAVVEDHPKDIKGHLAKMVITEEGQLRIVTKSMIIHGTILVEPFKKKKKIQNNH